MTLVLLPTDPDDRPMAGTSVVVGVDESPGSIETLRWVAQLAGHLGHELVVVPLGVPHDMMPHSRDNGGQTDHHARRPAWWPVVQRSRTPFRTVTAAGEPAVALSDIAERESADLIVVDMPTIESHDSNVHQLLARARVPVLVLPAGRRTPGRSLRRLLVVVDDPHTAEPALNMIRRLAAPYDAWINLVHVVRTAEHAADQHQEPHTNGPDARPSPGHHRLEVLYRQMRQSGVAVHRTVQWGTPRQAADYAAALIDPDLVVLTARGPGNPIDRLPDDPNHPMAQELSYPTLVMPADPAPD
jgi:nucleotide-binding universal stress UspA family protein